MKITPDFASPCGLYCGVCAIHIAHRDNNKKFKERLVNLYAVFKPVVFCKSDWLLNVDL